MKAVLILAALMTLPAQAHDAATTVPAAFVGRWAGSPAACADPGADDLRLDIAPDRIAFWESAGPLRAVVVRGDQLALIAELSGEGETWLAARSFELAHDGRRLIDRASVPGEEIVRHRCGDPPPPLASGTHDFEHRYAEHPDMPSLRLRVRIDGSHVIVDNPQAANPFPAGVIDEGRLMWHPVAKRWIIGHEDSDRLRRDVGGCSDGAHVIELEKRVFWTC
ncbi:hypothetical protein [Arenimonas composti]|nr:hypothetical protein [Arenimonas composti]